MSQHLDETLTDAASKNLSAAEAFEACWTGVEPQPFDRSPLPSLCLQAKHSIDGFNFNHHKTRLQCKSCILRLLDLGFSKAPPGGAGSKPWCGKLPLSVKIIASRACQANRACCSPPLWTCSPLAGLAGRSLSDPKLKLYTEPTFLLIDELGYLSLDQQTSNLFYQVISTRHSHKRSTLITTNTAFSEWGNILHNTTIATAIADRLVENSEIILLGGESLRKANKGQPPTE
jgi:hypothetical protein